MSHKGEISIKKIELKQHSSTFVKRLLTLAISKIAHSRKLFTEECFVDRLFDGVAVKLLLNKYELRIDNLQNSLIVAYDAIDKRNV